MGDGQIPDVLQERANPWRSQRKHLHLLRVPKKQFNIDVPRWGKYQILS